MSVISVQSMVLGVLTPCCCVPVFRSICSPFFSVEVIRRWHIRCLRYGLLCQGICVFLVASPFWALGHFVRTTGKKNPLLALFEPALLGLEGVNRVGIHDVCFACWEDRSLISNADAVGTVCDDRTAIFLFRPP